MLRKISSFRNENNIDQWIPIVLTRLLENPKNPSFVFVSFVLLYWDLVLVSVNILFILLFLCSTSWSTPKSPSSYSPFTLSKYLLNLAGRRSRVGALNALEWLSYFIPFQSKTGFVYFWGTWSCVMPDIFVNTPTHSGSCLWEQGLVETQNCSSRDLRLYWFYLSI